MSGRFFLHIITRTIANIEIIVFDYVMETPEGGVHGSFFFLLLTHKLFLILAAPRYV